MLAFLFQREDRALLAAAALGAGVAAALALRRLMRRSSRSETRRQPLPVPPTTLPVLGNLLDLLEKNDVLHDYVLDNVRRFYPSPFAIRAPGRPDLIVVSTPELFEDVVKTQFEAFGKGPGMHMRLNDLLGDSLTLVDGAKWRVQRKILARLFSARALRESITQIVHKNMLVLLAILREHAATGTSFDICTLMSRFTMEVFTEVGFGLKLGALAAGEASEFERAFDRAQYISTTRFTQPTPLWKIKRWLGIGLEGELKRCLHIVDSTVYNLIDRSLTRHREKNAAGEKDESLDIVSMAIEAIESDNERRRNKRLNPHAVGDGDDDDNEDETVLDATLLRAISVSALLAGRDTTSQSFCWFVYALSSHPEVEHALRLELVSNLPKLVEDPTWIPTMEDLQDLPYLEACVRETLRLYPAAGLNSRVASHDTVLSDGTFVPEGATVLLTSYSMGRLPELWGDDALKFKPERWLDGHGKVKAVSPFKLNAFLAGPRMCVGKQLAQLEIKILIASTVSRFHYAPKPGQHVTYSRSISFPMRDPFILSVQSARGALVA